MTIFRVVREDPDGSPDRPSGGVLFENYSDAIRYAAELNDLTFDEQFEHEANLNKPGCDLTREEIEKMCRQSYEIYYDVGEIVGRESAS